MPSQRSIGLYVLLGVLAIGAVVWRNFSSRQQPSEIARPIITKQPVNFAKRMFDPAAPPSDMPPLTRGEDAECDSEFLSSASVGGETRPTDATHATVTITQVKMTLQLNVTIWVPADVTPHVLEHEEGHRQISEAYYQAADKLAARIAARYIGKQLDIAGTDLHAESDKELKQMATEITLAYNKELDPGPSQLLYDDITDHSRNEVVAKDAVVHALKNVTIEATPP